MESLSKNLLTRKLIRAHDVSVTRRALMVLTARPRLKAISADHVFYYAFLYQSSKSRNIKIRDFSVCQQANVQGKFRAPAGNRSTIAGKMESRYVPVNTPNCRKVDFTNPVRRQEKRLNTLSAREAFCLYGFCDLLSFSCAARYWRGLLRLFAVHQAGSEVYTV